MSIPQTACSSMCRSWVVFLQREVCRMEVYKTHANALSCAANLNGSRAHALQGCQLKKYHLLPQQLFQLPLALPVAMPSRHNPFRLF
eukprot:1736300-Amphidinium_carterae.1